MSSAVASSSASSSASASSTSSSDDWLPPPPPPFAAAAAYLIQQSMKSKATQNNHPHIDLDAATESNNDTALTVACNGGHEELCKLLIEKGAHIEHRDKKGKAYYLIFQVIFIISKVKEVYYKQQQKIFNEFLTNNLLEKILKNLIDIFCVKIIFSNFFRKPRFHPINFSLISGSLQNC